MPIPADWQNPIAVPSGQTQHAVDPARLLPSRPDLVRPRLEAQRQLLVNGTPRVTPIQVTQQGVVFDGHHMVRAAAEGGRLIDVRVVGIIQLPIGETILDLPVR